MMPILDPRANKAKAFPLQQSSRQVAMLDPKAMKYTFLDTNGNGRRDEYAEPNQPVDAAKDRRTVPGSGPYAVMPSPVDCGDPVPAAISSASIGASARPR